MFDSIAKDAYLIFRANEWMAKSNTKDINRAILFHKTIILLNKLGINKLFLCNEWHIINKERIKFAKVILKGLQLMKKGKIK